MVRNNDFLEQPYKKQHSNLSRIYNTNDKEPTNKKDIISFYDMFEENIKKDETFDLLFIKIKYNTTNDKLTDIKNIPSSYSTVINPFISSYPIPDRTNTGKGENTTMDNKQIASYFKKILKNYDTKLDMNNKILSNMPIIKGTRIPVSLIVACLRDEMSIKEIEENYNIDGEEIEKAMDFVIEILDFPFQNEE